jgi:ParB/RepB/Spo0J family partition protein
MELKPELENTILELSPGRIKSSYERLRIIYPKADKAVERSLKQYGQLLPIVVSPATDDSYEILDGFKRFRGAKKLGLKTLKAKPVSLSGHALKGAIIQLNRKGSTMAQLEEAMIVHSLNKEDALRQIEIAVLLGRHKSWVCRRIALIEDLAQEVLDQIRLGLVGVSTGRELCRLPRGNQVAALETILKYHFTFLETRALVSDLLQRPQWEHENILRFPEPILSERYPPRPKTSRLRPAAERLCKKLKEIEKHCRSLAEQESPASLSQFSQPERQQINASVKTIESHLDTFTEETIPF